VSVHVHQAPGFRAPHAEPSDPVRVVFLAGHSALFQGLITVMQSRIPALEVVLIDSLSDVDGVDGSVRLVLLREELGQELANCARACRRHFPDAAVGLIVEDMVRHDPLRAELFDARLVQGLLPLSFELDVWLAAMSLLLSGGEYYPSVRGQRTLREETAADGHDGHDGHDGQKAISEPEAEGRHDAPPEMDMRRPLDGKGLTNREREVLELVSQGYQNKLIAHRMDLSEHTVKVHVHNLITKLGVSNRTQAAAAFRANFEQKGHKNGASRFGPRSPELRGERAL